MSALRDTATEAGTVAHFEGVETVFYQVCSMDKAIAFYRDVLGLELARREGNDWAEFRVGSVDLALSGELAVAPQQGGATVVLRTPDIEALDAHLAGCGVRRGRIEDLGGARMLDFYDPDGNQLVAMQAL
jgi:catechol 2,3-dioxygenase-like lactoylglutathione lyase family enzyme